MSTEEIPERIPDGVRFTCRADKHEEVVHVEGGQFTIPICPVCRKNKRQVTDWQSIEFVFGTGLVGVRVNSAAAQAQGERDARAHLTALVHDIASLAGDGSRSTIMCWACEQLQPHPGCTCACHTAREFLTRTEAQRQAA